MSANTAATTSPSSAPSSATGSAEFAIPKLPTKRTPVAPSTSSLSSQAATSATDSSPYPLGSAEHKDASVQGTSDDAATSKTSAMNLGYFRDDFLHYFVPPPQQSRRPPLINRGYWARVAAVTQVIDEFLREGEEEPQSQQQPDEKKANDASAASATVASSTSASAPSPAFPSPFSSVRTPTVAPPPFLSLPPTRVPKQIVSLGAGSDTNYFKLKQADRAPLRYIEIDFPVAAVRKAQQIRHTPAMLDLVTRKNPQQSEENARQIRERNEAIKKEDTTSKTEPLDVDLPSTDYALVGADLRDLNALEAGLRRAQVDFTLPTLILSECVLIYMTAQDSANLLAWLTSHFTGGAMIWTYEQIHPFDAFGTTMRSNLDARGCSLLGFTAYPDLEAHRQRYLKAGFEHYAGWDMNDIYRYCLTPLSEVKRIERIELFDEFEEWNMIQAHYHISVATKGPNQESSSSSAASASSSSSSSSASLIRWDKLSLLGKTKHAPVHETGPQVLLGGSGVRASAALQPNTMAPAKGSLKKPLPATTATTSTKPA